MVKKQARNDSPFAERVQLIRHEIAPRVQEIAQQFPMFTSHGFDHLEAVAFNARRISACIELSDDERFCLEAACYCHDVGMAHTDAQREYRLGSRDGVRRWHAQLSANYISNHMPTRCFGQETLRDAVARISEGHGRWDWDHPYFDDDDGLRIRLLTALLSLADVLDLRSDRRIPAKLSSADELMRHAFLEEDEKQNPAIAKCPELRHLSRVHWLRHYYSVQPGISIGPSKRTVDIRLKARIGLKVKIANSRMFDERAPLIKELIQGEVVELVEEPVFKQALRDYLSVRLLSAEGDWPSFVEAQPDPEKMLFPDDLVQTVFSARLVRRRSLPLNRPEYYKTRIEGFIGPADVQVSISWLPWFSRPDNTGTDEALQSAEARLNSLAERTWDFVLWPIAPFVALLRSEVLNNEFDILQQRFDRIWRTVQLIPNGQYRKYYLALEQQLPPQPMTATRHVAKFGLYAGQPATGGEFLGGIIELSSPAQRSAFSTAVEAAAKQLGVPGALEKLPEAMMAIANSRDAYRVTLGSIRQILIRLREELQGENLAPEVVPYLETYQGRIEGAIEAGRHP